VRLLNRLCWSASVACALAISGAASAQQKEIVNVTIDTRTTSAPINPRVYGQFLEHGGSIVNHGLWAELLDDRKFYGPILDAEPPPPDDWRAAIRRTRSWIRIGDESAVTLEKSNAYVGEHSPLLRPNGGAVGFKQGGVAVLQGKRYVGHIVASGQPGTQLRVSLIWGEGDASRQVVNVSRLTGSYERYALEFTPAVSTDDATLEVIATGSGEVRVGVLSLMPSDNIQGFRAEAVAALKQIKAGVYRFPGGNFVSAHEWRNAIGPRDKRPPIYDPVWKAVQPNDVGTDEFLALCKLLDVEPYITASAGFGDAWSAAQLVEYVNGDISTPMGKLRAQNGHPEPYRVKYWGIGNEPWGDWQFGAMPISQYVYKHNEFAKEMRKVDPSIVLIAGGAMPKTMTTAKQSLRFGKSLIPEPLSEADWNGNLFKHSLQYMDEISEHFYAYANTRFDLEKGEQVPSQEPLIEIMRKPVNHVRKTVEEYYDYLELFPEMRDKRVKINIDEWALTGFPWNSYKIVPANAWTFHEMFRHSDVIHAAAYTFGTSLLASTRTHAQLNPAGQVFQLYSNHFGRIPVRIIGDRPQPAPYHPVGGEQPKVNGGSDTYPLDVVAAWSEDRRVLTVAVVNPSESEHVLRPKITGAKVRGGTLHRLAHPDPDYVVTPGKPSEVKILEERLASFPRELVIPPLSASIYSLEVSR
jgi:alpha-N-arabinofuranosidase